MLTVAELSNTNVSCHVFVEDLKATAVFFRLARIAKPAGSIEDFGEGLEINCSDFAIILAIALICSTNGAFIRLLLAGIDIKCAQAKPCPQWQLLWYRVRLTYSLRPYRRPNRGFLPSLDSARRREASRLESRAAHGHCRACRKAQMLLCSSWRPARSLWLAFR